MRRAVTPRFIICPANASGKAAARIVGCPPSKPISGRLLAVADNGWRKKPGVSERCHSVEGVGVSPDIIDNIAEDGVAQGLSCMMSATWAAGVLRTVGVEGGKVERGRGASITEALHQIGGNILGGEAVFSGNDGRMQFLVSLHTSPRGGKGADMGRVGKSVERK